MITKQRFPSESELNQGSLVTFRRHLLLCASFFTFYLFTLLMQWAVDDPIRPNRQALLITVLGISQAIAIYTLQRHRLKLSSWILTLGSLLINALIYIFLDKPITLGLYILTVLWATLLLEFIPSLFHTAASVVAIILLNRTGATETTWFWVSLVCGSYATGIVMSRSLGLIDHWENLVTTQQSGMIEQLRIRQGELNRSLKALNEAYVSLRRTKDELFTARQEAEQARALKEQFVANVSHELRTPLNLIIGFSEMMYLFPETYEGVGWTTDIRSDIGEMYRAGRHLQSLIDDVLDLSRINVSRLPMFRELTDIRPVVREAMDTILPLLRQRSLSYEVVLPDSPVHLYIDRIRIRQIMLNLLNNAVRFTDVGTIKVTLEQLQDTVVVGVHDTGVGIQVYQLERIFEAFTQADGSLQRRGGTGLGLALSRQFAQLHGGQLWAESEPGVGSTFWLSIPTYDAGTDVPHLLRTPDPKRAKPDKPAVIVVDPDMSTGRMLGRHIEDHRIIIATNCDEADELVIAEHPRAVIVNLPPEAPPDCWFGAIGPASHRYAVPIVRCSTTSPAWIKGKRGIDDILTKPISRQSLIDLLERHCTEPSTILVVDSSAGLTNLITRILSTSNLAKQVIVAYEGSRISHLVTKNRPDLILIDLQISNEDSYEVIDSLRRELEIKNAKIIAMTTSSYVEDILSTHGQYLTVTKVNSIDPGKLPNLLNALLENLDAQYQPVFSTELRV
jgi:signal transduction histidine kinase/CheY-like chemotaxis protein